MKYAEYLPSQALQRFINCFWYIESAPGQETAGWDRSVPDGSLELVLHLGDPMLRKPLEGEQEQESRGVLIGQTTRPYLIAAAGRTRLLGVRFYPHTGFLFLDGPVAPFNDRSVDLDAILPRARRLPVERIGNAGSVCDAIAVLESWCVRRLQTFSPTRGDTCFARACRAILKHRGEISVTALAGSAGIGTRQLEKLFRERSGVAPKLLARMIRFHGALGRLTERSSPSFARIAQESGYFDQSHFIREFRHFTGLAPREFMRERHPFTQHFAEPANSSHLYNFR